MRKKNNVLIIVKNVIKFMMKGTIVRDVTIAFVINVFKKEDLQMISRLEKDVINER